MRTWRDRARWGTVLVLLALPGLRGSPEPAGAHAESAPAVTRAVEWPTSEFKVVHRPPPQDSNDPNIEQFQQWFDEVTKEPLSPQDKALGGLIEGHLRDAAVKFQAAGLLAPTLNPFRDASDGLRLKYVVYLGAVGKLAGLKESANAYHSERLGLLAFNRAKHSVPTNAMDSAAIYRRAAHELLHAIQSTYRREFGSLPEVNLVSKKSMTITEGMAEGAGMYLAVQRFSGYLDEQKDQRGLGGYDYSSGFLTDDGPPDALSPTDPYNAGSFWFHLAERFGGLSILDQLMRVGLASPQPTSEQLLEWLDNGLRFVVRERLPPVYTHFITELASYGGRRYRGVPEDTWLEWVLNPCDWYNTAQGRQLEVSSGSSLTLTPTTEVVSARLSLEKMGAMCFRVHWKGFEEDTDLKIEVRHPNKAVVDQMHLGTVWSTYDDGRSCWDHVSGSRRTSCEQKRLMAPERGVDLSWARTWRLPESGYGGEGSALFVLTNTAFHPWTTVEANEVDVVFSFARTQDHTGQRRAPARGMHLRLPNPAGAHPPAVDKAGAPVGDRPSYWHYRTYGINPDPPVQETLGQNLLPITPIVVPKGTGPGAIEGPRYIVTPHPGRPLPLGSAGPLYGFVLYEAPPGPKASGSIVGAVIGKIGSPMCPDADKRPIGQVLVNTKDLLKVRVQTDLCTFKLGARRPTVVERLDVTVVLPFGWRYQEPAPRVEITPGVDYYVLRYFARLEGRLEGDWPFSNPKPDITPGSPSSGAGSDASPPGSNATSRVLTPPCDCSCEGFRKFQELSKRRGDPKAEAEMKAFLPCVKQCMTSWVPGCARQP